MKAFILSLLLSVGAFAQFNTVEEQTLTKNYLQNGGFESGKAGWTVSAGTISIATSGSNLLTGKASAVWDSGGAAEVLSSEYLVIPNGLKGRNGEVSCVIMSPSGTLATHVLRVYNGSSAVVSGTINNSTNPKETLINFPVPTSGSLAVQLVSSAANEPPITIDECRWGQQTNIGSVATMTDWQSCTVTGTWVTNTTYSCLSRINGDTKEYQIKVATSGAPTSATLNINLPSGDVIDPNKLQFVTGTDNRAIMGSNVQFLDSGTANLFGFVGYESTTSVDIWVNNTGGTYSDANAVTQAVPYTWASGDALTAYVKLPIVGLTATSGAVKADQTNYPWTSYTPVFTGFGTVTGINCTHSRDGENLKLRCTATAGTTTATEARVSLPGSLVSRSTLPTLGVVGQMTRSGGGSDYPVILIEPSKSYVVFGQGSSGGGTVSHTKLNGNQMVGAETFSFTAEIPIEGWTESQNAPILLGSVTSQYSGPIRVETAVLNCDSGSAITSQNGSWISSIGNVSAGACAVTMASGMWVSSPQCFVQVIDNSNPSVVVTTNSISTTNVTVDCDNSSSGTDCTAYDFNLMCVGAR